MLDSALIDYNKCQEYARALCGSYGIPEGDAEDVGSDAFLLSIRRSWRTEDAENAEAVARRLMYTSVLNVINRRNKKAIRVLSEAEELYRTSNDEGALSDDEIVEERFTANDGKSAAEKIGDNLDWQNPFWLRLFKNERQKLRNEKRKSALRFIKSGLKDSRLSVIRGKLQFSWGDFQTIW